MSKNHLAIGFGQVVRQLRTEQGLSQEDLASKSGLHRTYIGSIERGEKTVTINTAYKISNALQIKFSTLFIELEKVLQTDD
jgi:transcriptional regulator with XRE-family HTH domain